MNVSIEKKKPKKNEKEKHLFVYLNDARLMKKITKQNCSSIIIAEVAFRICHLRTLFYFLL